MKELQELINSAVNTAKYPNSPKELYEPISYLMALGGKRMRPLLVLMGYQLFKDDVKKALPAALAVETFHNFTLMHDDIMDNAPLRRGKATVHEKWNSNIAILSGDVMLVEAYKLLCTLDKEIIPDILNVFNKTAVEVCEGQQWDMNFESRSDVSIAEYLKMIEQKTAILLGASLKMGALLAGGSQQAADALYAFGVHIGIAFQLQDDWLDVFGDPEHFGKQVGGDILANKKTYLLLKTQEVIQGEDAALLQDWLKRDDALTEKVQAITALYIKWGVGDKLKAEVKSACQKAFAALDTLEGASTTGIAQLKHLADELMDRQV